jgi:predicted acylesterase/phospholipase RssA
VDGPLDAEHVLASSAIPVAFPPVQVMEPEHAEGWYADGGIRLNTPLHPAVGLGATKILGRLGDRHHPRTTAAAHRGRPDPGHRRRGRAGAAAR